MSWEISDKGLLVPDGTPTVCWDLDSTIRSTMHRRHLLPEIRAGRATWDDYSLLAADDVPIAGSVALLRLLHTWSAVFNVAVTGASAAARELTVDWCYKHNVPLDDFIMRPAGDKTPNEVFKVSSIRALQAAQLDVQLFVEDWEPIARYIAEQTGIPVLGVNPFDADAVTVTQDWLEEVITARNSEEGYFGGKAMARDLFTALKDKRDGGERKGV